MSKTIQKIALGIFKDKKILFVRSHKNQQVFYTLGGKLEEGESDIDCLKREVKEEVVCEIDESSIKFLHEFKDIAHGKENTELIIRLYEGRLIGEPKPAAEIAEVGWFDSNSDPRHFSEMAVNNIIPWLKENDYIS